MLFLIFLLVLNINPNVATRYVHLDQPKLTVWERLLQKVSNGTGNVTADPTLENLMRQGFEDLLKRKISQGQDILGHSLDPLALFPIGPLIWEKRLSKGEVSACHLHLHNIKEVTLDHVEVKRGANLTSKAVKILLKVPIVWLTGNYQVKKALFFGVIPTKSRGSFNIDLKDVTIGFILSLTTDQWSISIDQFEVGLHWLDVDVKFDTSNRGINKLSDMFLSKLELGDLILQTKRTQIMDSLEQEFRALFECGLSRPYEVKQCIIDYWISQGWEYPWVYPTCGF